MTAILEKPVHRIPPQEVTTPGLAELPVIGAGDFRNGMRHLASGVSIITAAHGGQRAGLTATAVCSVTADPPRLVVFVNKNVVASELIKESGALCVNLLSGEQEESARVFAGMIPGVYGEARFDSGDWTKLVSGAPVLSGSLASFDCRVIKLFDESTHNAYLCEVLAMREGAGSEDKALVYLNGAFRHIER